MSKWTEAGFPDNLRFASRMTILQAIREAIRSWPSQSLWWIFDAKKFGTTKHEFRRELAGYLYMIKANIDPGYWPILHPVYRYVNMEASGFTWDGLTITENMQSFVLEINPDDLVCFTWDSLREFVGTDIDADYDGNLTSRKFITEHELIITLYKMLNALMFPSFEKRFLRFEYSKSDVTRRTAWSGSSTSTGYGVWRLTQASGKKKEVPFDEFDSVESAYAASEAYTEEIINYWRDDINSMYIETGCGWSADKDAYHDEVGAGEYSSAVREINISDGITIIKNKKKNPIKNMYVTLT